MASPGAIPDIGHLELAKQRRLRVYQNWQGNEVFFCGGRLVAGPNWKASFGTAFLAAAPGVLFLVFPARYLMETVTVAILVIGCVLLAASLAFLFVTAVTDPGILPRLPPDEEYLQGRKPRTKEYVINGQRVLVRYNDTCHFYQPPRAHHCSVNDNCVEKFDHHCPWVGTTIGLRNYRTFLLFIVNTTVLTMYVFACSAAAFFLKHRELASAAREAGRTQSGVWVSTLQQQPIALALMIYTFIFFWFVGGLSCFHCYLVATNQTTYENFRYSSEARSNPYNKGCLGNCADVWCMRVPKPHIPFRGFWDEFQRTLVEQQARAAAAAAAATTSSGSSGSTAAPGMQAMDVEAGGGGGLGYPMATSWQPLPPTSPVRPAGGPPGVGSPPRPAPHPLPQAYQPMAGAAVTSAGASTALAADDKDDANAAGAQQQQHDSEGGARGGDEENNDDNQVYEYQVQPTIR